MSSSHAPHHNCSAGTARQRVLSGGCVRGAVHFNTVVHLALFPVRLAHVDRVCHRLLLAADEMPPVGASIACMTGARIWCLRCRGWPCCCATGASGRRGAVVHRNHSHPTGVKPAGRALRQRGAGGADHHAEHVDAVHPRPRGHGVRDGVCALVAHVVRAAGAIRVGNLLGQQQPAAARVASGTVVLLYVCLGLATVACMQRPIIRCSVRAGDADGAAAPRHPADLHQRPACCRTGVQSHVHAGRIAGAMK